MTLANAISAKYSASGAIDVGYVPAHAVANGIKDITKSQTILHHRIFTLIHRKYGHKQFSTHEMELQVSYRICAKIPEEGFL